MGVNKGGPAEYKTFPSIALKFDEDQGIVDHVITVFGVLDHVKDISHPGSFKKTIQERQSKVRVLDMHRTDSIMRVIAKPVELKEVGRDALPKEILDKHPEATGGVQASTKFLMDTPEGKGAFIRLKEGAVDEWSYGYDAVDTDYSTIKQDGEDVKIRNLRQIRLYEYGPVLWGANPATVTLSAKTDSPSEAKPAPEVTENTIRIRVRDPGDFDENAFGEGGKFRTIPIGSEDSGIQATIGKLKGETTTTVQGYIFAKDKFSVEEAQAWVDEHKKDDLPEMDEKQDFRQVTYNGVTCQVTGRRGSDRDGKKYARTVRYNDDEKEVHYGDPNLPMRRTNEEARSNFLARHNCDEKKDPFAAGFWACYDWQNTDEKQDAIVPTEQDEGPYRCECLECGHVMESEKHCRDIKCSECGGDMRRAEKEGDESSEVSAVWTTAYMNDLPDSAFLYIAPGGEKDEDGKTKPRNLRYFPYKDADGSIDLPHLRNAIARIPQSNAPGLDDAKKNALQERARRMLEKEQEKSDEPVMETPEEVVFASVILQNVLGKLDDKGWERKAAELAIEKLRALYSDGKTEDEIAEMEAKAGRVLSSRNATRIANALTALIDVLENAGIDIPGYGKEPGPMTPPKENGKNLRLEMEILGAELDMLELE